MLYTLEHPEASITVSSHGAELHSFRTPDREWMWEGDPQLWGRHTPTCFPWCGKLKDGYFIHKGEKYEGGQHGFARDMEHILTEETGDALTFRLDWNEETLKQYPWKFSLETRHQLTGTTLATTYQVTNLDQEPMPFQVGFHFAFSCPFTPGAGTDSCRLRFEQPENFTEVITKGGFVAGRRPRFTGQQVIDLDDHLFDVDSICFTGLTSQWAQIEEPATDRTLRVSFPGFPQVLIWSKPGPMRFLAIEPWHGLPDTLEADHNLFHRPSVVVLQPGESFSCTQTVEIL